MISSFENNDAQKIRSSPFLWLENASIWVLKSEISKKKWPTICMAIILTGHDGDLRCASFNCGFYRFWFFRAASVTTPAT